MKATHYTIKPLVFEKNGSEFIAVLPYGYYCISSYFENSKNGGVEYFVYFKHNDFKEIYEIPNGEYLTLSQAKKIVINHYKKHLKSCLIEVKDE